MDETVKNLTNESGETSVETGTEFDAVTAINELKQNTVPKAQYEQVVAEKNKYLKALIDGSQIADAKPKAPVNIDELRQDLFSGKKDLTNLEYAKKSLELREALIERDGVDIFVGRGSKLTPTDEDYEAAQRVADAFQQCIEVADGDSEIFTRELMRITEDAAPHKINPKIRR